MCALSLTDVFLDVPDEKMSQFIMEATKIYKDVEDHQVKGRLIALHAADRIFSQMKAEQEMPVESTPFTARLLDLQSTLPPPRISWAL